MHMVHLKTKLPLAVVATLAIAAPAGASPAGPAGPAGRVAHSAGGDAPPLNPAVVGIPILRTQKTLDAAADAIDAGQGADAAGPLKASRRALIRSYAGAKYLIAQVPPPPAEEARVKASKF